MDPLIEARESVADLVQSVCREVLQRLEQYRFSDEQGFRRWLFRTADRKVIDRYRYYTAERRHPSQERTASLLQEALAQDPEQQAEAREELQRILVALQRLPPAYREVIRLSRLEGLSHANIAERLQKSEGAVRNMLYRGIAAVSEQLEKG